MAASCLFFKTSHRGDSALSHALGRTLTRGEWDHQQDSNGWDDLDSGWDLPSPGSCFGGKCPRHAGSPGISEHVDAHDGSSYKTSHGGWSDLGLISDRRHDCYLQVKHRSRGHRILHDSHR